MKNHILISEIIYPENEKYIGQKCHEWSLQVLAPSDNFISYIEWLCSLIGIVFSGPQTIAWVLEKFVEMGAWRSESILLKLQVLEGSEENDGTILTSYILNGVSIG